MTPHTHTHTPAQREEEARQAEAHVPAHTTKPARGQRKASTGLRKQPAHQKQSRGARGSEEEGNRASATVMQRQIHMTTDF